MIFEAVPGSFLLVWMVLGEVVMFISIVQPGVMRAGLQQQLASSGLSLLYVPAVICLFSSVLRMGRAELLSSTPPKSAQLQLIQGQSTPRALSFERPVHSSWPRQCVENQTFGSLDTSTYFHISMLWLSLRWWLSLLSCVSSPSSLCSQPL